MKIKVSLIILVVLLYSGSFSQIVVTQNSNAISLGAAIQGTGVNLSNLTLTGDPMASGIFINNTTDLGISQGVVLSNGKVSDIPENANILASTSLSNCCDAELSTLTTGSIYDKCILEFDLIPSGTILQFSYVFASEEYPQFVCSPYNDVFGFFVSGSNPLGGSYINTNIALLPNGTPVCINSINDGITGVYQGVAWNSSNCISLSNSSMFIDNLNPINPDIVYNGMTIPLVAIVQVIPCQTYHLKIAIADVGDRIYDSAVFIAASSLTSSPPLLLSIN